MQEIEKQIKETVKTLFKEKKIDVFIGYKEGTIPLTSSPVIITKQEKIDKLCWNSFCSNNLAVYLPEFFIPQPKKKEEVKLPKVGILAKGCDARSIVGLIKEHQVPRKNVVIVGIACEGMIDKNKVKNNIEIFEANEKDNKITITDDNSKKSDLKKEELLSDCCISCEFTSPVIHDILIGTENKKKTSPVKDTVAEEFGKMPLEKRWGIFEAEMSKCIRCYACREACPNCYCTECFAEQTKPKWLGISNNISDIMFYQIGRIFHQAGRCVDCGACVRACPVGIDLRTFTYKLVQDAKELFNYTAGSSMEDQPPLASFKEEDKQDFIVEP